MFKKIVRERRRRKELRAMLEHQAYLSRLMAPTGKDKRFLEGRPYDWRDADYPRPKRPEFFELLDSKDEV